MKYNYIQYLLLLKGTLRVPYGSLKGTLRVNIGFLTVPLRVCYGYRKGTLRVNVGILTGPLRVHYGYLTGPYRIPYGSLKGPSGLQLRVITVTRYGSLFTNLRVPIGSILQVSKGPLRVQHTLNGSILTRNISLLTLNSLINLTLRRPLSDPQRKALTRNGYLR